MSGKKAPMGWLKGVLTTRNDEEHQELDDKLIDEPMIEQTNSVPTNDSSNYKNVFSRENQDKITLDLIVSVENIINDRQILSYKNKDLTDQLHNANEMIKRLKHEQHKRDQQINDYEKTIHTLEENLSSKQMSYDQLIEDYKEYQSTSNEMIENLKFQIEKEQNKYAKLEEEMTKYQYQYMQQINHLEERIRDLETDNQQTHELYQKIREEKTQLLHTINDFTARMSYNFTTSEAPKNSTSDSQK